MWSEVTSVLAVYCTTTSDTDICHHDYVLDLTSQWSASHSNNITMLCHLHMALPMNMAPSQKKSTPSFTSDDIQKECVKTCVKLQ